MTRPRFSFRPNLHSEEHRRAWAALQAIPAGQRSAFLVRAILRSVREELRAVPFQPVQQPEEGIPQEMMGFLSTLMEDDET